MVVGLLVCCLFTSVPEAKAQDDSLRVQQESSGDTTSIKRLDPRKALFYSAVFPGLGQMYNNKYWKLPFVYGGFVITISVVNFYQKNYHQFRDELYGYLAAGAFPTNRPESRLRYAVDKARRERDYYVIITGIWYMLQIVDAHVDAHLQEFKWNKDMRISLQPAVEQNILIGRTTGFTLTFKF